MPTEHVLILLLVFGATQNKPVGSWITYAIAEYQVQPPAHLIDEVVHVAFEAAIIVAGKNQPSFLVHEHPAGKMNGANARQIAANVNMTRSPVHQPQQEREQAAPEEPGLDAAHDGELVGHVVVLKARQLFLV